MSGCVLTCLGFSGMALGGCLGGQGAVFGVLCHQSRCRCGLGLGRHRGQSTLGGNQRLLGGIQGWERLLNNDLVQVAVAVGHDGPSIEESPACLRMPCTHLVGGSIGAKRIWEQIKDHHAAFIGGGIDLIGDHKALIDLQTIEDGLYPGASNWQATGVNGGQGD